MAYAPSYAYYYAHLVYVVHFHIGKLLKPRVLTINVSAVLCSCVIETNLYPDALLRVLQHVCSNVQYCLLWCVVISFYLTDHSNSI